MSDLVKQTNPNRKPLTSDAKRIILNVFSKLTEINPEVLVNNIVKKTVEFNGVFEWSLKNICKELKETDILQMPVFFR